MNLLWGIIMWNAGLSFFSTIHARADNNVSRCNTGKFHPTSDIKGYVLVLSNVRCLPERMSGIILSIPDLIIFDKTHSISLLHVFTKARRRKEISDKEQYDHFERPKQITENWLLPTDSRVNTVYWSNKNHMPSTSSRMILTLQNGTFDKWVNNKYLKNVSVQLFSIFKNGSLEKRLTIIDHMDTICDGFFLMHFVSVVLFSFWKNDSLDKRLTADRVKSHNGSFEISEKQNSMVDISDKQYSMLDNSDRQYSMVDNSDRHYSKAAFRVKTLYCYKWTLDRTTNQTIASLEHNWNMKNSNVLKTISDLEEEMQIKTNVLHYTRTTYLYLALIMNKCQRNSHLLSREPAISTNGFVSPMSRLYCILFWIMCTCICLFKSVSSQKFYLMLISKKTTYWFVFQISNNILNKCCYFSVYFPNLFHHVHKIRNEILQKLYPIVSPSFRITIIRRYKRYQRDIIRTKVKEFFESYVKWLKAFNLKQKYGGSANIGNTSLKKRRRKNQLRGGRKRKCSFRKTGPFTYGKQLYKRNSLQRTSHLRRAFNVFMSSSQNSLDKAITSTQPTVTKTGKMARDAANNIRDLYRLRWFPQTLIAVFPFLGSSIEFSRVATYATFPTRTPVSTLRLARAGFFYTGSSDLVECFHCHVQHGNWETNDIPFEIHERISPSCDFILGNDTANTAIDRSSIQDRPHTNPLSTTSLAQSRDCETNVHGTLTSGELQTNSSAYASIGSERSSANLSTGSECFEELHSDSIGFSNQCTENSLSSIDQEESGGLHQISTTASQTGSFENREHSMNRNTNGMIQNKPIHSDSTRMAKMTSSQTRHHAATVQLKPLNQCHDRPKYIAYAVLTVRMSSFKGWSSYTGQTPRELAAAGLFYSGCGDLVRCWFCGISLQSWETSDDPWIEHAKWAPTCLFMRRSKGDEFIQLVHERNNFCSHSNSTRNVEEPSMSPIQNAPEEIQTPLHLAASVERVKAMGYSTGLIQKAIETLQRDNTPIDTNSIVNELIENERSYFSNKPDRVKVSELAWNTAARASEVDSCSNGLTEGMRNLDIQESNRLMKENRRLRQELKCKICMDVDAVITFVPCGHMICCEECGYAVSKCPVCRRAIETRVKTWMS